MIQRSDNFVNVSKGSSRWSTHFKIWSNMIIWNVLWLWIL